MGINFGAATVFGRKLYGGRSQHKIVDLGKPATRLGKACTEREQRAHLGSRALRFGMAAGASQSGQRANGAAGTRATWMGKTERSNGREHMSQFQDFGVRNLDVTHFISLTLDLYMTPLLPPSYSRLRANDRGECKNISP